jgi:hypothetical protein
MLSWFPLFFPFKVRVHSLLRPRHSSLPSRSRYISQATLSFKYPFGA